MLQNTPLRFAVIGCGRIALNHGQAISALEEATLVAAADIVMERTEAFTTRFGGEAYRSYKEMLERTDIDAVSICTPSGMHAEMGISAAKAGKHVLVEKPMALSLRDADALISACKEHGVTLGVVHQNRFNPVVVRLRQAMEAGRFGQLNMGTAVLRWHRDENYYEQAPWRGTWAQDGGCLMNQTIHCIDLLQWMMGPVESVCANTATRMRNIEAEDNAAALVRFRNGGLGMIESSVTVYPKNLEETLNIFGATGTVVVGGVAVNRIESWRFADGIDTEESVLAEQLADPASVYGHGHRPLIRDFIEAIRSGRESAVPGLEGRKALEIILAIYRSARTGKSVQLPLVENEVMDGSHFIHSTVRFGQNIKIGYFTVIEAGVELGDGVDIGNNVTIHTGTRVGADCRIGDNAVIGKSPSAAKTSTLQSTELPPLQLGRGCTVGSGALIYAGAVIGEECFVADTAQIRERCKLGRSVIVGRGATVENDTTIGDFSKLQTGAYITAKSTLESHVFIAPGVTTSNDNYIGRTEERHGRIRGPLIRRGARVGAGAVILPGVEIGIEAMVAAGAVVTKDVPPYKVVMGCPARTVRDTPPEHLIFPREEE